MSGQVITGGRWGAPSNSAGREVFGRPKITRAASSDYDPAPWRRNAATQDRVTAEDEAPPVAVEDTRSEAAVVEYNGALDAGVEAFSAGRLPEAVERFRQCAHLWPEHPTPPYNLACCYSTADQLETAKQYLWSAVERGAPIGEIAADPDLVRFVRAVGFAELLKTWERRVADKSKAARRVESNQRPWRDAPPRSRPSSATSAAKSSRGRVPFGRPEQVNTTRSRSRSRSASRERPQSAPPQQTSQQQLEPVAASKRRAPSARASTRRNRSRRASSNITRSLDSTTGSRGALTFATLRPAGARPSSAAPTIGVDPATSAPPDYLSKGYGGAGFGVPDRICIEVGNTWSPVPEIHARLACQCGREGAEMFPTTVEEWESRLDLLTDAGALKMSTAVKSGKAADHGLQVLRDALAARRKMYGTTIRDLKAVFDSIDKDGSGALDHDEFAHAMHRLGLGLADEQIKDIIHRFDADGDGEIDYEEFAAQLAARPLPEDDDDAVGKLRGPPLPAPMLAKYQYSEDTQLLNTESWQLVVRDASGKATLGEYISHVEFRMPEDSGFDETTVICYEEPYEVARIGHDALKVLITLHLKSGGGYCFEHVLSFEPGARTDGGGNTAGGKMRRVQFQPVEATQAQRETQARKEREATAWWEQLEAQREKHAAHPRFPVGSALPWTEGMREADASIRDKTAELRSEHAKALSELQTLREKAGALLTEEETARRAELKQLRKAEAAKLRAEMAKREKAHQKMAAAQAAKDARVQGERDALSILRKHKYSDALARRNASVRATPAARSASPSLCRNDSNLRDGGLNDPGSASYAAELRQLEASITGGTLGSLQAAGEVSKERMAAELSAREIVADAAVIAEREVAMEMAYAQAEADERLEVEASDAPRWSEWSALQGGGVEVALAADSLYALGGEDSVGIQGLNVSEVTAGSLDDTLAKMQAEIASLEVDFAGADEGEEDQ